MNSTTEQISIKDREGELLSLEEKYRRLRDEEQLPEEHPKVQFVVEQFRRCLRDYEQAYVMERQEGRR